LKQLARPPISLLSSAKDFPKILASTENSRTLVDQMLSCCWWFLWRTIWQAQDTGFFFFF
jgi:hypothetical protein